MTPSAETRLRKDIKALFEANDALDAKQSADIVELKARVRVLEKRAEAPKEPKKKG
jgi:hypothetical protein